ncbi:hypothetical protein M0813_25809 [Anaeramoeba flamelloides]|uniref:Uncharacterized protein n=1 Tax=Anaeramoeba flamelloides TaxID=1746091 RepID=A0ABQ8Y150_9EUKA|nr:hypothetical protein M0813_25809 [Anaeramoeba flamelloides]
MNSQNELLTEHHFKTTTNVPRLVEYEKEMQVDSLFLNEDLPNIEMCFSSKSNFENDDQVLCSPSWDLLGFGYNDTIFRSPFLDSNFDSQGRSGIEDDVIKTETFPEIFANFDNTENVWSNYNETNNKISSESLSCYPLYLPMNSSYDCVSENVEEGEKFPSNDPIPYNQQKSKKTIINEKKLCPSSKAKSSQKPTKDKHQVDNSHVIQKINNLASKTSQKENMQILESLKSNYLKERQNIERNRTVWINNYDNLNLKNEFKVNQKNSNRSKDKLKIQQEFDSIHQTLESLMIKSLEQFESDFLNSRQESDCNLNTIVPSKTKLKKKNNRKLKMENKKKNKKKTKKKKTMKRRKKEIQLKFLVKKQPRKRIKMSEKCKVQKGNPELKKRRYLHSKKSSKSKNRNIHPINKLLKKKKKTLPEEKIISNIKKAIKRN